LSPAADRVWLVVVLEGSWLLECEERKLREFVPRSYFQALCFQLAFLEHFTAGFVKI
jgi:hypothetical protein